MMKTCRRSRSLGLEFSFECVKILNSLWGPCFRAFKHFSSSVACLIYDRFVHVSSFQMVH